MSAAVPMHCGVPMVEDGRSGSTTRGGSVDHWRCAAGCGHTTTTPAA